MIENGSLITHQIGSTGKTVNINFLQYPSSSLDELELLLFELPDSWWDSFEDDSFRAALCFSHFFPSLYTQFCDLVRINM